MPMLRLVSLDLCDASDGDFEIPDVSYRRAIFFKKKDSQLLSGSVTEVSTLCNLYCTVLVCAHHLTLFV